MPRANSSPISLSLSLPSKPSFRLPPFNFVHARVYIKIVFSMKGAARTRPIPKDSNLVQRFRGGEDRRTAMTDDHGLRLLVSMASRWLPAILPRSWPPFQ